MKINLLPKVIIFSLAVYGIQLRPIWAMEPKSSTFSMAPEVSYWGFKADNFKEPGFLYGIAGSYTYRGELFDGKIKNIMLKLDGRVDTGKVDYQGTYLEDTHKHIANVTNFLSEIRGLAGHDFSVFASTRLTPYIGLGYRFAKDDLSKDFAGYRRLSNYFYSPIGVETSTPIAETWSLGFMLEYDLFWLGRQESDWSDLDVVLGNPVNDQSKGYGLRSAVKLRREMEDKNLFLEPFINFWSIGRSKPASLTASGVTFRTVTEPKNHTLEVGARLGVEF